MTQPTVLRSLMEGPVRPWQCLVWAEASPPPYSWHTPPLHTSGPSHVLLQVSPYYEDINSEYRGGGVVEEIDENEGGGVHRIELQSQKDHNMIMTSLGHVIV